MTSISKAMRAKVRAKFGGLCAYCGCELPKSWHVDHMEPVGRDLMFKKGVGIVCTGVFLKPENHREDNFMPACPPCNIDKSGFGLEGWRMKLQGTCAVLTRNSSTYRHGLRFGQIIETAAPIVFYFERIALQAAA